MERRYALRGAVLTLGATLAAAGWAAEPPPPKKQALMLPVPPATAAPANEATTPSSAEPALAVKQYTLSNGLTVMLSEDHALPSVAAHLVYLVGSGHEEKGRTGFAHLFEHLMFQGSANYDHEYFAPFEPIGARTNGTTSADRTVYYEQVPSQYSELPLWMESDRMRSLLPALTQAKLDNQREVVKNERRQRYEVTPYGLAWSYLDEALYPEGHPYHHSTIGSHADLSAATLDDVRAFFDKYYVPKNTGLSVVGDFDETVMRAQIEKYFGDIAPGERAAPPAAQAPVITSPKHWVAEDDIQLPRVYFAWITPALFAPGDAELDLLSTVLSDGKTSRLFKSLVYERKLAKDIAAFQHSQKLNSAYIIQATASPGTSLDELANAIKEEVQKALSQLPAEAELNRARNGYKKGFFQRLETYSSRASLIGSYFLHTEKGDYVRQDYQRYLAATAQQVQQSGKDFLNFEKSVRLDIIPGKKSTPILKLEQTSTPAAPATQGAAQ